jgi:hypothetical protein
MIQFLLTEDSIYIPEIKYNLSRENILFDKTLKIIKSPNANIKQLNYLVPNLSYDSELISIEHSGSKADIYYNGKYYKFPPIFLKTCIQLFRDETSITNEIIAKFLLKLFKNPNHSFKDLWSFLEKVSFNFLDNGNIIVYKKFEDSDERNKNRPFEQRKTKIETFDEDFVSTIIEIDPSEIIDGYIYNFKIKEIVKVNYLFNTYVRYIIFNAIFDILTSEQEDVFINLSNLLQINIKKVFNKYQIKLISNSVEDYKERHLVNYSIIMRLCQ